MASLHVENLPPCVAESDLSKLFECPTEAVKLCRDSDTQQFLGKAIVTFKKRADAEWVIRTSWKLMGKRLKILWPHQVPTEKKQEEANWKQTRAPPVLDAEARRAAREDHYKKLEAARRRQNINESRPDRHRRLDTKTPTRNAGGQVPRRVFVKEDRYVSAPNIAKKEAGKGPATILKKVTAEPTPAKEAGKTPKPQTEAGKAASKDSTEASKAAPKKSTEASLLVENLPPHVTELHLYRTFQDAGPIESVTLCRDCNTQQSLGSGHVIFRRRTDAEWIIKHPMFWQLMGRPMKISWTRPDHRAEQREGSHLEQTRATPSKHVEAGHAARRERREELEAARRRGNMGGSHHDLHKRVNTKPPNPNTISLVPHSLIKRQRRFADASNYKVKIEEEKRNVTIEKKLTAEATPPKEAGKTAPEVLMKAGKETPKHSTEAGKAAPKNSIEVSKAAPENSTEVSKAAPENSTEVSKAAPENSTEVSKAAPENSTEVSKAAPENSTEASKAVTQNSTEASKAVSQPTTEERETLQRAKRAKRAAKRRANKARKAAALNEEGKVEPKEKTVTGNAKVEDTNMTPPENLAVKKKKKKRRIWSSFRRGVARIARAIRNMFGCSSAK